jgi:hypothetical protein
LAVSGFEGLAVLFSQSFDQRVIPAGVGMPIQAFSNPLSILAQYEAGKFRKFLGWPDFHLVIQPRNHADHAHHATFGQVAA